MKVLYKAEVKTKVPRYTIGLDIKSLETDICKYM